MKKQFTTTCKYCNRLLVVDECNTGADHHRSCGIAYQKGVDDGKGKK